MELSSLVENPARYEDVYLTGFSRIAEKDAVFHHVTYHFKNTVLATLKKDFAPDGQFNMMSVGVGIGKHEIALVKTLREFYKKLSSTAIEPNANLLRAYKENVQSAEITPPVDVKYFHGTFRQYLDDGVEEDGKFNLISGIHSLYYLGQIRESMDQLLVTLKENGILLLQINSKHSAFVKLGKAVPSLNRQDVNITFTGEDVTREAERRGCDVTKIPLQLTLDVTEIFDETSDFGNKILDFFTMTSYFRQTAPKALVEEVMEFWRDNSSRDESGRYSANFEEYLMIVQKYSQL
ncbi:histamine N-methyltransferase B-like [Diadema antillarum]|uniref:histamine N-methyltransferase B-like n=1 Tax=Diadema antillarum TaxID=105358 RepID=UPI003A88FDC7